MFCSMVGRRVASECIVAVSMRMVEAAEGCRICRDLPRASSGEIGDAGALSISLSDSALLGESAPTRIYFPVLWVLIRLT